MVVMNKNTPTQSAEFVNFTPTGRITQVRARAMSESQLRAALKHPVTSVGGKRTVLAELRARKANPRR